jgi:hypothetical protein
MVFKHVGVKSLFFHPDRAMGTISPFPANGRGFASIKTRSLSHTPEGFDKLCSVEPPEVIELIVKVFIKMIEIHKSEVPMLTGQTIEQYNLYYNLFTYGYTNEITESQMEEIKSLHPDVVKVSYNMSLPAKFGGAPGALVVRIKRYPPKEISAPPLAEPIIRGTSRMTRAYPSLSGQNTKYLPYAVSVADLPEDEPVKKGFFAGLIDKFLGDTSSTTTTTTTTTD